MANAAIPWSSFDKKFVTQIDEAAQSRFLRGPSLGALLFTQGFAFGARLYVWFLLSLIPIVGIPVLFILLIFGRRLSWKHGGWASFEAFQARMKLLDIIAVVWLLALVALYFFARKTVS